VVGAVAAFRNDALEPSLLGLLEEPDRIIEVLAIADDRRLLHFANDLVQPLRAERRSVDLDGRGAGGMKGVGGRERCGTSRNVGSAVRLKALRTAENRFVRLLSY
jgi:hypothetical protein